MNNDITKINQLNCELMCKIYCCYFSFWSKLKTYIIFFLNLPNFYGVFFATIKIV